MILLSTLTLQIILSSALSQQVNCNIKTPPKNAGETQAHGVILYIHPRSHTIDKNYTGCQSQWFYDDDYFRKLSVIHYTQGIISRYDNINLNGLIGYSCVYKKGFVSKESDKRCPKHLTLKRKTYQSGCYSNSTLNHNDSYEVTSSDCQLR